MEGSWWQRHSCLGHRRLTVGKTNGAIMLINKLGSKNPNLKVLIIVPSKVLKDQWKERCSQLQNDIQYDIQIINSAIKKHQSCDLLVVDEIHKAASTLNRKIFINVNYKAVIGLTATYERLDGAEKDVLDLYCPPCDLITIEEATRNGWLSQFKNYRVMLRVDLTEYKKINKQFLDYFNYFDYQFPLIMSLLNDRNKLLTWCKTNNKDVKTTQACVFGFNKCLQWRKKFISDHPKKIEIAKRILAARPNAKAIVFNNTIELCNQYEGFKLTSKENKKHNQEVVEQFNNATVATLVTSQMANEGLDLKGVNLLIQTGYSSSQTVYKQRIGRGIRKELNKISEVFTLVLQGTKEQDWAKVSSQGSEYIEIDEQELNVILANKELINKDVKVQENCTKDFRY